MVIYMKLATPTDIYAVACGLRFELVHIAYVCFIDLLIYMYIFTYIYVERSMDGYVYRIVYRICSYLVYQGTQI